MRRRLLTIFAAAVLGVTALVGASPATADVLPPGVPYVALGDSESAGTGNLPYVDEACKRSAKSYPLLLGFASSACSGATVSSLLPTETSPGQFRDLGTNTFIVTITVGANDIGWLNTVIACTSGTAAECAAAQALTAQGLAQLPTSIGTLVNAVHRAAPNAHILVTGYPVLFGAVTDSCSIGAYQGAPVKVTAQQAALANLLVTAVPSLENEGLLGLNTAIYLGVSGSGVSQALYVDLTRAFAGHALCDSGDRWISGLVSGKKTFDRGLHINAPGQEAVAAVIARYL